MTICGPDMSPNSAVTAMMAMTGRASAEYRGGMSEDLNHRP